METNNTTNFALAPETIWVDRLRGKDIALDPSLRRVVELVQSRDWDQLYRRTGIRKPVDSRNPGILELSLFAELESSAAERIRALDKVQLKIPRAYLEEAERNANLTHITARLRIHPEIFEGNTTDLIDKIAIVMDGAGIKRLSLATPFQPCLAESRDDLGMPSDDTFESTLLDGNGVVVGVIDDGCALAHHDFLIPSTQNACELESRVQFLWDQSATPKNSAAGWQSPADFGYGSELNKASIDTALNVPGHVHNTVVNAERLYDYLDYNISAVASHGTHVMSIATGNGRSLMGSKGIAPAADIVFVQLPQAAIESGGPTLNNHIYEGVMYIFERARLMNKPAVINVSYGGYRGPHDGTTELEAGIDQMLESPNRMVVVAAGNGFEADCHAQGTLDAGSTPRILQWVLRPEDPTSNYMEIWYNGNARIEMSLTPPDSNTALGPVLLNGPLLNIVQASDQKVVGSIDHITDPKNHDNKIVIALAPTSSEASSTTTPVPSGIWKIALNNTGASRADFHAWIERDASGGRGNPRRQQSHFAPVDAHPGSTLGSFATGKLSIAVGAYNTATQEISRYSACGPTRAIGSDQSTCRQKPEVCAPAEGDSSGRGTLSASSLSALPTRMNGTSASAPHVTGLVALMYQILRDTGRGTLSARQMIDLIKAGAQMSQPLQLNRHQATDDTRPLKQKDMNQSDLTGTGKINIQQTLSRL